MVLAAQLDLDAAFDGTSTRLLQLPGQPSGLDLSNARVLRLGRARPSPPQDTSGILWLDISLSPTLGTSGLMVGQPGFQALPWLANATSLSSLSLLFDLHHQVCFFSVVEASGLFLKHYSRIHHLSAHLWSFSLLHALDCISWSQ